LHLADSGGFSHQIWRIRKKSSGNAVNDSVCQIDMAQWWDQITKKGGRSLHSLESDVDFQEELPQV
jgi:hypothetical protein